MHSYYSLPESDIFYFYHMPAYSTIFLFLVISSSFYVVYFLSPSLPRFYVILLYFYSHKKPCNILINFVWQVSCLFNSWKNNFLLFSHLITISGAFSFLSANFIFPWLSTILQSLYNFRFIFFFQCSNTKVTWDVHTHIHTHILREKECVCFYWWTPRISQMPLMGQDQKQ